MLRIIFTIGVISILVCGIKSCYKTSASNLKNVRQNGYNAGFASGQKQAEDDYSKKIKQNQIEYEALLENNKKIFEDKVTNSYNQGKKNGIKEMSEEINSAMTINTKNKKQRRKKSKQKWNEVISTDEE